MASPAKSGRKRSSMSFLLFFLPTAALLLLLFFLTNSLPHPTPSAINLPLQNHHPAKLLHPRTAGHHHHSRRWGRRWLKFLGPSNSNESFRFSARAEAFFNSSACRPRFFMTWISPLATFGPRELYSIDALFGSHPDACLLVVSDSLDSAGGRTLLKPFSARGFRLAALSPDYSYLFNNTPAERMIDRLRSGEVPPGEVPIGQNLSNLLRLLLLYKYGGVYVDADVVVLKSFLGLRNAIGAQTVDARTGNWTRLNNAVLVFDEGHPLLCRFIEEFARSFDGSKWGHNGPYLVSRVATRVTMLEFAVLPPPAFYPVDWKRIGKLFVAPKNERDSKRVAAELKGISEGSFAVHLWNRQSRRMKVEAGSVMGRIMSRFCTLFCNSSSSV